MVRRYEELIEVRSGEGAVGLRARKSLEVQEDRGGTESGPSSPEPSAFLWRGRLYIVRDVLGHWRERRAWWREALDHDEEIAGHGLGSVQLGCLEQEVWRVEASPGRLAGTGVYDLGMNGIDGTDGPTRSWRLLRVAD
ncbi:MAG: hypothetical protein QOF35_1087 [Actinomycetota bacterium]|jgi:hypothetical protein|nr:hypothetical protein [Actinomycetota bacterium]